MRDKTHRSSRLSQPLRVSHIWGSILFQKLEILFPYSSAISTILFFCKLEKLFLNFIWTNRRPRIQLSLLYLPYDGGGLQVPNLQWYYWAAQLHRAFISLFPNELSGLTLQSYLYFNHVKKLKRSRQKIIL